MDRGAWQATAHGVAKSQTGLNGFHFTSGISEPLIIIYRCVHIWSTVNDVWHRLSSHCCLVAQSCLTHGPQRRFIHSVCSAVEEDGILVSGSKVYVSHHLYIYFYCYHYFYYYSYQYGSLRIKVCIFKITQQEKNQGTYFQNYSTQESFSLTALIDKKHISDGPLITQNDSHTTPPTWLGLYFSSLLGSEFFPLCPDFRPLI